MNERDLIRDAVTALSVVAAEKLGGTNAQVAIVIRLGSHIALAGSTADGDVVVNLLANAIAHRAEWSEVKPS